MSTDYSVIEKKILEFIKKYYLSNLVRGIIITSILFLIISFLFIIIEHYNYLSIKNKTILVGIYSVAFLIFSFFNILLPLLGFVGIRRKLSQKKINQIIVNHFPQIKDQLWNLFELKNYNNEINYSAELISASIDQKIKNIKIFKFSDAIQLKSNLKITLVLLSILFLGTLFSFVFPNFVKDSSIRLKNFTTEYIKPSPFKFKLINENLSVGKGENYEIRVKIDANKEYENLFILYGGNTYLMSKDSTDFYSYQFNNLNNSIDVIFKIENYSSKKYKLSVLPKPLLSSFKVDIIKPKYTNLKTDKFENITEIVVPIGSECNFKFFAYESDSLIIRDNLNVVYRIGKEFCFNKIIRNETELTLSLKNKNFDLFDFLKINISILNDEFPSISINQFVDSLEYSRIYFKGSIEDDYGFDKLNMVISINNQIDTINKIEITQSLLNQDFFYAYDFSLYKGRAKNIQYYFEIFDNDGYNGSKSSISEIFGFVFPDSKDIFEYQDKQFNDIENILSRSMQITKDLKKDMFDLKEKMINTELSEWERKEIMKNIYSKKNKLEDAIKNIHEKNDELNNYMDSFTEQNKDLIEKQEQIQKMLEEVMSDELKKLMDEFNDMMQKFNENKMNELSEQMDISLDDLSKQLDKNLELLKRMKIEKQLELIKSDIDKHIEKQNELADAIDKGEKPSDLLEKQQKEKDDLQELKEQYDKVEELNKQLDKPLNLYDFKKEFNEIDKEFKNSLDQQQKNNRKKSLESMDKNKSNMKNLSFMMQQMIDAAFQVQRTESLANLLQILDNTIIFSFDQEKLILSNSNIQFDSQSLVKQKKLYQDFQVIKDSLYALAKREPSVNMAINKEIVDIENNFSKIDKDFSEDRFPQAKINQQYVLTAANNLALFLSEVIKQLQQQQANSTPGDQNCEKPGNNSNPSSMSNSMKSMQQSLQKQLEKMMQMMKDGQSGNSMNGEMGKALSQQEKMQNMLQKMMNQGNVGSDAFETLKQAESLLNKTREDIIRNNISNQTINRQKEILTRLLEAENAENEREIDDKRKSNTAEKQRISETAKYFDNNNSNDNFKEKIVKQKLTLKKYYQKKYQIYINQLDSINGSNY